jgi:FkbM family methyltransferase
MNFIKRFIFKILGVKRYLRIVSRLFFISFFNGMLKGKKSFYCHYFTYKLINKGDYIIDLGANLGYYSLIFSKLTGNTGKVFSIEPVEMFREILIHNTRKQHNIEIIPFAIGPTDHEKIKMGVPASNAYFSHGRTHVLNNEEDCAMVFDAITMRPESLFGKLEKLDYIKCDIEGFESVAIPLFKEIIEKFFPILQIEIAAENLKELVPYLRNIGYSVFEVEGERLMPVKPEVNGATGDLIFIRKNQIGQYINLMKDDQPLIS